MARSKLNYTFEMAIEIMALGVKTSKRRGIIELIECSEWVAP